ncbi:enterobactin exporter EntS [compost metagenome]
MGISLGLFAIMHGIWLKMVAVLLMGLSTGVINVLQTSLIQVITPTNLLGRVMSFLTSLSNASLPFGALIGGMLALRFPLETVLLINAVIILISGFVLILIKTIREFVFLDEDEKETEAVGSSGETVQV